MNGYYSPPGRISRSLATLAAFTLLLTALVAAAWQVAAPASAATSTTVVGAGSGRCLTVTGGSATAGAGAELWDCDGQSGQQWDLTAAGELRVFNDTMCLDAYQKQTAPGTKIDIWSCNGGSNQQWRVNADGTIIGAQSGLCLDATSNGTANGTGIELWTCTGGSNQKWTTDSGGTGSGYTGQVSDTNIAYVGRWDTSSTVATAHWAGAYLQTAFTGTSVKVRTRNAVSFYASIDGGSYVSYSSVSGTVNLTPKLLTSATHTLRIEYSSGDLAFEGLVLDSGAYTVAPGVPSGLLEFVGDSITAGAEDPRGALDAYGWKTGEQLHLRHTQIARAGYCLVAASGCVGQDTQFFDTDSTGSVPWDFSRYHASAVIINLGTNDLGHSVSSSTFQSAYTSFLRNIRAKYPNAAIFVMETFKQWYVNETKAAVSARNSAGDAKVYYVDTTGWLTSSDYVDGTHPTAQGHTIIANHLAPIIAAKI
jgi:lysophospholipase L1-like esterase